MTKYEVTTYMGLQDVNDARPVAVTAGSAEDAALLIVGEDLVRYGHVEQLRAKVTFEKDTGGQGLVLLYRRS